MRELSHSPKTISFIMLGFALAMLAGCSGEPSTSDVEKAVKKRYPEGWHYRGTTTNQQALVAIGGSVFVPETKSVYAPISEIKKLDCASLQAVGAPACTCNVEIVYTDSGVQKRKNEMYVFVRNSDGWVLNQ